MLITENSKKILRDGELNPDLTRDKRPFWPLNYHGLKEEWALTLGVEPRVFWLEVRRVAITPRELKFLGGCRKPPMKLRLNKKNNKGWKNIIRAL